MELISFHTVKENHPGWSRLAAVIESDANFLIFRKFGFLRTRLVVWHQDRLRELEERLRDLDDVDFKTDENTQRALCDREGDDRREPASRRELFERLSYELQKYGQYSAPAYAQSLDSCLQMTF